MSGMGLTKARSMGPVASAVQRAGGSVARMLRQAELPAGLMERPEYLIPLRDQLRVLEFASRETGDEALAARLSLEGGVEHLGTFGRHVCRAHTLARAIAQCNESMGSMLQSATRMHLLKLGRVAKWTYTITDAAQVGRQKNELLALGYMLDLARRYFGVAASSIRAELPGPFIAGAPAIQDLFGCGISRGEVAALVFPCEFLDAPNRTPAARGSSDAIPGAGLLPETSDFVAHVERMLELGFLDCRPREDWLCRRLGVSRRTLQRSLALRGTSFSAILQRLLLEDAARRLASRDTPITRIAFDLGYSDPAHFTRAFIRSFGESPQSWRRRMSAARA